MILLGGVLEQLCSGGLDPGVGVWRSFRFCGSFLGFRVWGSRVIMESVTSSLQVILPDLGFHKFGFVVDVAGPLLQPPSGCYPSQLPVTCNSDKDDIIACGGFFF